MRHANAKALLTAMLLLPCLGFGANAQSRDPSQSTVQMIAEDYDPLWNVSGNIIVGIMASADQASQPYLSLKTSTLRFTPDVNRKFCVVVVSRSRSYRATAEIDVPPDSPLPVSVILSSAAERPDFVDSLDSGQIAVTARMADCAHADHEDVPFLVAEWGEATGNGRPDSLKLMLNARTSEVAVNLRGNGQVLDQQQCARTQDPQQAGYDFTCELSLALVPESVGTLDGTIARRNFGSSRQISHFSILLKE